MQREESEACSSRRDFLKTAAAALPAIAGGAVLLPTGAAQAKSGSSPMPAIHAPTLTSFGDFRHRCLFDPMKPDFRTLHPEARYRDLSFAAQWLWGSFYDADGNCMIVTRELPARSSNILVVYDNKGQDACRLRPESAMQGYRGPVKCEVTDKSIRWLSLDYGFLGESSYVLEMSNERLTWEDKGVIDIAGDVMPVATQWYDPMPEQGKGLAYVNYFIRARGTILGRQVDGWMGNDVMYLASGQNYVNSPMATRGDKPGVKINWQAFGNEYADGSWEYGFMGIGLENWGFVVGYNSRGEYLRGSVLGAEVDVRENGHPRQIRVRIFDEVSRREELWVWNHRPKTDLVDIPRLFPEISRYLSCEGTMMRADEKRRPKRSYAWPDFYSEQRRFDEYRGRMGKAPYSA